MDALEKENNRVYELKEAVLKLKNFIESDTSDLYFEEFEERFNEIIRELEELLG